MFCFAIICYISRKSFAPSDIAMDAGFYRGTSTDQDIRFTDKERKLLRQMKFENVLDTKIDLAKINLDVIKPWITLKLNEILGMEDDVVVEYVFTQLEEKELNPKKMQINLTGFLNARRAREFMGELWQMFVEAQSSPEGIPTSLVEKKVQELKASNSNKQPSQTYHKATEVDWNQRYQTLTGGRYGKSDLKIQVEEDDQQRKRRDPEDDRDERAERRMKYEEARFKERKDLLREKQRHEEKRREKSSSPESSIRRFSERGGGEKAPSGGGMAPVGKPQEKRNGDEEKEKRKKSKKEKSHKRRRSESDSGDERGKKKKHKKEKKSKKHKERD
uniref:PWI domain-containing protein n=1 Tax=Globodera rostochiensis TaxID=31243 RepID=A0A914HF37_GLORO